MGDLPLGKFIFLHLVVLVSIAYSISFLAPVVLIEVRAALPHVRVFFPGLWSSVESLLHENMVLPLGWSHSSCGVYLLVSSVLCAVLPFSDRVSAASFRGSPRWALTFMRKVLAPAVTLSWRICTISRTISPSGVVARFARVSSPTHLLMVFRRDSLSVR